ncbi:hypothetical protein J6590_032849 [Homalodisca vitripennis]|nr:hypothetical protein J6590_032849 [Homalodisca vitripennis]
MKANTSIAKHTNNSIGTKRTVKALETLRDRVIVQEEWHWPLEVQGRNMCTSPSPQLELNPNTNTRPAQCFIDWCSIPATGAWECLSTDHNHRIVRVTVTGFCRAVRQQLPRQSQQGIEHSWRILVTVHLEKCAATTRSKYRR